MGKATGPTYKVSYRRRRKNATNYTKRLALIKSESSRLVVRASNKGVLVQVISFDPAGDKTLACAKSSEVEKFGWLSQANTPTAYLTGALAAKKALAAGAKSCNLDIGMSTPSAGRILFAAAMGAKDAGLALSLGEGLVDMKRIDGSHISEYAKKLEEENKEKFSKQFSRYIKKNVDVKNLPSVFAKAKGKILSG